MFIIILKKIIIRIMKIKWMDNINKYKHKLITMNNNNYKIFKNKFYR